MIGLTIDGISIELHGSSLSQYSFPTAVTTCVVGTGFGTGVPAVDKKHLLALQAMALAPNGISTACLADVLGVRCSSLPSILRDWARCARESGVSMDFLPIRERRWQQGRSTSFYKLAPTAQRLVVQSTSRITRPQKQFEGLQSVGPTNR
jgi:hypothetical protein